MKHLIGVHKLFFSGMQFRLSLAPIVVYRSSKVGRKSAIHSNALPEALILSLLWESHRLQMRMCVKKCQSWDRAIFCVDKGLHN
jgi:hypothetical protein